MTPFITEPQFCPRKSCRYYNPTLAALTLWYKRCGSYDTLCRGTIQRFRCRSCGKTCSTQTFSIHYWTHSTEDYQYLLRNLYSCGGLLQHGRYINLSFRVVQNRIRHLARNCMALLDAGSTGYRLGEDLVMDGFESYTRSQYFPNNITIMVGSVSDYVHGAIHTLLRRKGRMSDAQLANRAVIDRYWRPPKGALQSDCTTLLRDQAKMIDQASRKRPVTLWTDEHQSYPPAMRRVCALNRALREGRLRHRTVSSRAARTIANPLFPVNYVDRQIRKNMGEHVRETVKQGREVNCQMERMAIFMVAHNFLTPHRIVDGVNLTELPTHAAMAGIDESTYRTALDRLYTHRFLWGHMKGTLRWQEKIWHHRYTNPPAFDFKKAAMTSTRVALPPGKLSAHFLA